MWEVDRSQYDGNDEGSKTSPAPITIYKRSPMQWLVKEWKEYTKHKLELCV